MCIRAMPMVHCYHCDINIAIAELRKAWSTTAPIDSRTRWHSIRARWRSIPITQRPSLRVALCMLKFILSLISLLYFHLLSPHLSLSSRFLSLLNLVVILWPEVMKLRLKILKKRSYLLQIIPMEKLICCTQFNFTLKSMSSSFSQFLFLSKLIIFPNRF